MNIQIRKGGIQDTARYLDLLHEVKYRMAHPEWFCVDPDEKVQLLMREGKMELWLAEDGEKLAGAFSIIHPGAGMSNLGNDLGFDGAQLQRVVHMDTAAVHPDYRGMKLQYRLMVRAEQELRCRG